MDWASMQGVGLRRAVPTGHVLGNQGVESQPEAAVAASADMADIPPTANPSARQQSARRALAKALHGAGFRAKGEPVSRAGTLMQPISGDFSAGRAELWAHPTAGRAHVIKDGFLTRYYESASGTEGQTFQDVLGLPLSNEYLDPIGRVLQDYEYGQMIWTPEVGVQIIVKPGAPVRGKPTDADRYIAEFVHWDPLGGLKGWSRRQVQSNRHIGAVYRGIEHRLQRPNAPQTIAGLLRETRRLAFASLATDPSAPTDPTLRAHLANVTTLVSLAAHAVENARGENKATTEKFPPYLPDGRPKDAAYDRSWHFVNHGMLTYLILYADRFIAPETATSIMDAVAQYDPDRAGERVRAVYDTVRGQVGSVLPGTLPGPPDAGGLYAPEPEDLSDIERRAYRAATRIGYAHELHTSPKGDVDQLAANLYNFDPFAKIDATLHHWSGLGDPNWVGDVTANNLGAEAGIAMFRAPTRIPTVPKDVGWACEDVTFDRSGIAPEDFLGLELTLVRLISTPHGDPLGELAASRQRAQANPEQSVTYLLSALEKVLPTLDLERRAQFYAGFAIRFQRWSGRVPGLWDQSPLWDTHANWARNAAPKNILASLQERIRAAARVFSTGSSS